MLIHLFIIFSLHACMIALLVGVGGALVDCITQTNGARHFNRHSVLDWIVRLVHIGFFTMLVLGWIGMIGQTIQGTLI